MSKKLSDLDKDQRVSISADVDSGAALMGVECIYSDSPGSLYLQEFGLCSDCKNIRYATSLYRIRKAYCYSFSEQGHTMYLTPDDPITECTQHDPRGVMDIHDMKQIAWLIEDSDKEIGF